MNKQLSIALVAAYAASCCPARPATTGPVPEPAPVSATQNVKKVSLAEVGLSASAMDRNSEPCDNFYQFACGGWISSTEIPADKSRWVRSFNEIHERNEKDLKEILDVALLSKTADPIQKKLGAYYGACMNEPALEKQGTAGITGLLQAMAHTPADAGQPKNKGFKPLDLEAKLAKLHQSGVWGFFDIDSGQDFKDATQMIAHIDQNGLGMPDRDYYLKDDDKSKALRASYEEHVMRMFRLIGFKDARAKSAAATVLKIETDIAQISKSRVERRDPKGMYNKIDRPGLRTRSQAFNWDRYFELMGLTEVKDVSVTSIPFVEGLNGVYQNHKPEAMAEYLMWQVLHNTAGALPKAFVDEHFKLTQVLTGQEEQEPRWKRCTAAVDHHLGELLAQAFVAKRFSEGSKKAVLMMVNEISAAFKREVQQLQWMDDSTRQRALGKLTKMAYLIGYPDKWKTYDFAIDQNDYTNTALNARRFTIRRELAKIGHKVDRGEWFMTPPTVNAYYNPLLNQMVFPAGILQPPFYNPDANIAVNLGAMGMVVGHELTHGFDDQGAQFDADGNLKSWWEPSVEKQFTERTGCVEHQYEAYEVLPGVALNGKLTLGENIADIGGVKLAYSAYRAIRSGAAEVLEADGFNEDQQFFISLGQVWCAKYREEETRMRAKTDPHSAPMWRVNGSLQNTPAFAQAFGCAEGTPMRPANMCTVW